MGPECSKSILQSLAILPPSWAQDRTPGFWPKERQGRGGISDLGGGAHGKHRRRLPKMRLRAPATPIQSRVTFICSVAANCLGLLLRGKAAFGPQPWRLWGVRGGNPDQGCWAVWKGS